MDRVVGTKFHRGLVAIPTRLILRYNTCGVGYWLLIGSLLEHSTNRVL
ncbi:hypothetical protein [Leptospira interrogans]|nr:hypothetical protein [Leptospira interrogans]